MAKDQRKVKLKVCLIGEKGVGKTSLLNRYVFNSYSEPGKENPGTKMSLLCIKQIIANGRTIDAEVSLFDLMGDKPDRDSFKDLLFWGAHGFIAVADATKPATIRALPAWIRTAHEIAGKVPYRILINKVDLVEGGEMRPEDSSWLLDHFTGVPYDLTSAKGNSGVKNAFDSLIEAIVANAMTKSEEKSNLGVIASKILGFAKRRAPVGISKRDLLMVFKGIDHDAMMKHVDQLKDQGMVIVEESGPVSFIIKITPKGEKTLEQISRVEEVMAKNA